MRILKENSLALIIDVQEKLLPHMEEKEKVLRKMICLIGGLRLLGLEIILTQQYTRGLGSTLPEIYDALGSDTYIEKRSFSCCDEPEVMKLIADRQKELILVAGIETHVCVLQTCVDLKSAGFQPVLIVDATSSRNATDHEMALVRLRQEGIWMSTVESILFELTRTSENEVFKKISALVK